MKKTSNLHVTSRRKIEITHDQKKKLNTTHGVRVTSKKENKKEKSSQNSSSPK